MGFVSVPFIFFISLLFIIYFSVPKRKQWIVLLIFSYCFYAMSGIWMLGYLLFTTLTTFYSAILIEKRAEQLQSVLRAGNIDKKAAKKHCKTYQRFILLFVALANFGLLFIFKYMNSILTMFNSFFAVKMTIPRLIMPLGISFYMFQSMGYVFDIYRGKYKADTDIFHFALFVSFFPQILQGPISRYSQLAYQLYEEHEFSYLKFKYGALRIMWGYFKKLVISDRALIAVNIILGNYTEYAGLELIVGMLLFMLQIYTDFSGGIDITIGISECMGITLTENFCRPHFAASVEEYWRRWHITLGSWMKEYVFYPLALSKTFTKLGKKSRRFLGVQLGKVFPTCLAMLITFLCVGIWHGSDFKYIAFGLYNGFWIILGILFTTKLQTLNKKYFHINTETKLWRYFKIILTMFIIMISKVFGIAPTFQASIEIIKLMFSSFNPWILVDGSLTTYGLNTANWIILLFSTMILIFVSIKQEQGIHLRDALAKQNLGFRWLFYLGAMFTILIFGIYGIGYDAASFFYMQY